MIPFSLFLIPSLVAAAYTFKFTSVPTQCQELSLSIEGQGDPPYQVLIIPDGPSPLANDKEVRSIIDQTFPDNGTIVSIPLRYPATSHFVATVRFFALISISFPCYLHTRPTP